MVGSNNLYSSAGYCAGGYRNGLVPSDYPSISSLPSQKPSLYSLPSLSNVPTKADGYNNETVSSQYPVIPYSPISVPLSVPVNSDCSDYEGWVDSVYDTCSFYETYDQPGCPLYGSGYATTDGIYEGLTAVDACCKFLSLSLLKLTHNTNVHSNYIEFINVYNKISRLLWWWG